jgi:hypothetical protein
MSEDRGEIERRLAGRLRADAEERLRAAEELAALRRPRPARAHDDEGWPAAHAPLSGRRGGQVSGRTGPSRGDPLAAARARGGEARQRLIERAGPMLTAAEVAAQLGIGVAEVERQRAGCALLAVELEGEQRFPGCQLTEDGVRPGLERFLTAFRDAATWTKLSVLLAPSRRHGGRSALDLLRAGEIGAAVGIARRYGEQG